MGAYDIAIDNGHEFSNVENDNKWKLYGAPQRTQQIIQNQVLVLEKQKEVFMKEMESEQEGFKDTLELLKNSIDGFANNFKSLDDYKLAAEAVESINARLQFCDEEMKKYNLRETLCG
jgi:hypothetical protein